MKKVSLWLLIFICAVSLAFAQTDDATQQQIDKLSGQIQDLEGVLAVQNKRIEALEKQISQLADKLNQPAPVDNSASADDLKKLAEQVQEIDKKRQADNDLILKEIEKLGKLSNAPRPKPVVSDDTAGGNQKGYDYEIHSGDTISAIVKAYRDQGIKVTTDQILKANPKLDPKNMQVGQKIFIPAPTQ